MTDLMELLHSYAQDYMMRGLLDREGAYEEASRCADRQEAALREILGEEGKRRLEDLMEERKLASFLEGRALFSVGFQMAVELTR